MTDERELHPSEDAKQKETSGEYLWRVLKPGGAILVLILFVIFLVFCFTYRSAPQDSAAPQTTATVETLERGT